MTITITYFIYSIFRILQTLIIIDAALSWFMPNVDNDIVHIIRSITDPLLLPGRKLQERFSSQLPFDFSPVIAIVLLSFVQRLIISAIVLI